MHNNTGKYKTKTGDLESGFFNEPPLIRFAFAKANQNGGGELIPKRAK